MLNPTTDILVQPPEKIAWPDLFSTRPASIVTAARDTAELTVTFPSLSPFGTAQKTYTFTEFRNATYRTVNAFSSLGMTQGDTVNILLPHIPQALWSSWAIETLATAIPISPNLSLDQTISIASATQPRFLVTLAPLPGVPLWDVATKLMEHVSSIETIIVIDLKNYLPRITRSMATMYTAIDSLVNPKRWISFLNSEHHSEDRAVLDFDDLIANQSVHLSSNNRCIVRERVDQYFQHQ